MSNFCAVQKNAKLSDVMTIGMADIFDYQSRRRAQITCAIKVCKARSEFGMIKAEASAHDRWPRG